MHIYDKVSIIYKAMKLWPPRIYPMRFAKVLVGLHESMKQSAKGKPQLPMDVPSALKTFREDWVSHSSSCEYDFADLSSVYKYLRGNRNLRIPTEWRGTIPDRLGW